MQPVCPLCVVQLLGELLLDRSNVKVMVRFVSEVQHLMMMMMLLKDQSRSIQFEAFHVFKVGTSDDAYFGSPYRAAIQYHSGMVEPTQYRVL